jgi:hypothetical protein
MPSSADLHNENARAVLVAFFSAITSNKQVLSDELQALQKEVGTYYNLRVDYGTLYVQLITSLRNAYTNAKADEKQAAATLIYHLYHNDNRVLERTYNQVMDEHIHTSSPTSPALEEVYRHYVSQKSRGKYAAMSPYEAGGNMERLSSTLSSNFDPMSRGLPTIRHYGYKTAGSPIEYRFPTQAQRVKGIASVDPLFEGFLDAKPKDKHVYFNFLRRDERKFSGLKKRLAEYFGKECKKENEMTHALESFKRDNLTVITLPADDALMNKKAYLETHRYLTKQATTQMFVDVMMSADGEQVDEVAYKDFNMSPTTRFKLGFLSEIGKGRVKALLAKSFKAVGLDADDGKLISEAQRQAVWFDFVNFQLPQAVMSTLNPAGFNFSCKDAIDRGGVASAWYNLRQSFETTQPMSREEFEQALHAAPLSTKGRGMNEHVTRLWNMVNEYVDNNVEALKDPGKSWLILWRDMHCPKPRAADVLETRLASARVRLQADPDMQQVIEPLLKAIEAEKGTLDEKWMGTLLEVVGRTMSLVEHKVNNKLKDPAIQAELKVYAHLIKKVSSHAELGLFATFMLWIQGKLIATIEARSQVVEKFKQNLNHFFPEKATPSNIHRTAKEQVALMQRSVIKV